MILNKNNIHNLNNIFFINNFIYEYKLFNYKNNFNLMIK
jgi:hypothetical protein